jgi:hypothetical protein
MNRKTREHQRFDVSSYNQLYFIMIFASAGVIFLAGALHFFEKFNVACDLHIT